MPKGKPKKDNPALYEGSLEPSEPSMTRQVAAHRRGGTHKVRDEHRTDSIYDTYNYKELLDEAKERGIYRKDMRKVEMAWALKHNDEEKKRAERDAVLALQRKQQEAKVEEERRAAEKQKQIEEKHKRRIEKERRRERDESVSDDTLSDADIEAEEHTRNEYKRENFGQALSDESWDSTSTESSAPSMDIVVKPDCRLRLFEWPYERMPLLAPTLARTFFSPLELLPRHVPYVPLKITTTSSKQKFVLPGLKYPPGIDPDFVPILNAETRTAARNGHLLGSLRKATVESGVEWAQRTLVQGWNAHMYFHLGSRNETKVLADTYTKWCLENRKLLRVKGKGDADTVDRTARHSQRHKNKAKKTVEVYEASLWRPNAMCYVPAYLDYGHERRGQEEDKRLENLFFVRFPRCDVPHYYFWTREGEWSNPSFPNPAWEPRQQNEDFTMKDEEERRHLDSNHTRNSCRPCKTRWTRVRNPALTHTHTHNPTLPQSSSKTVADTITLIEHHLYHYGLSSTLSTYRQRWLANGKAQSWKTFAAALPTLWPSGQIPNVPPVESIPGANVAVKLAMIDHLKGCGETMFSPLHGGEAWTRDDDKVWDVVEVEEESGDDDDDDEEEEEEEEDNSSSRSTQDSEDKTDDEDNDVDDEEDGDDDKDNEEAPDGAFEEIGYETDDEALYRRCSVAFAHEEKPGDPVVAWLEKISPRLAPPTTLMGSSKVKMGLEEWEERYLQNRGNEKADVCPFCCMPWDGLMVEACRMTFRCRRTRWLTVQQEQARHVLSHSTGRPAKPQHVSESQHAFVSGSSGARETNFGRNPKEALHPKTQRPRMHHHPFTQERSPVDCDEAPYMSPCVQTATCCPTDHQEAAPKPRKRSINGDDGLELLDMYSTEPAKRRKIAESYFEVVPHTRPC
jgi:hypothetical protein